MRPAVAQVLFERLHGDVTQRHDAFLVAFTAHVNAAQIEGQAKAHGLPPERVIREVMLASQPTRRFVEVSEVAALVVFLCGEDARSITGACIPIDGGWTAR